MVSIKESKYYQVIDRIRNWKTLVDKYDKNKKEEWIFRGQADFKWGLKTSIEREIEKFCSDEKSLDKIESGMLRYFKRQYHNYATNTPEKGDIVEWLSLMQHYGAPTRLLDFTHSFYVALYFAVEDGDKKTDAAVWAIKKDWMTDCFKKKDSELYEQINDEDRNLQKHESFKKINGKELVITMGPYRISERLKVQQGTFLLPCDIRESLEDSLISMGGCEKNICKFLIPGTIKSEIIKELFRMNITSATLFPGIDGFSRSIKLLLALPEILKSDEEEHTLLKSVQKIKYCG